MQTSKDPSILDMMVARGSESWIKLDRPLPVYILYFTAWAEQDGTLRFHHDVYGRDEQLERAETQDRAALTEQDFRVIVIVIVIVVVLVCCAL